MQESCSKVKSGWPGAANNRSDPDPVSRGVRGILGRLSSGNQSLQPLQSQLWRCRVGVPTAVLQQVPVPPEPSVAGQQFPILAVGDLMQNCSEEGRSNLPSGMIIAPSAGPAWRTYVISTTNYRKILFCLKLEREILPNKWGEKKKKTHTSFYALTSFLGGGCFVFCFVFSGLPPPSASVCHFRAPFLLPVPPSVSDVGSRVRVGPGGPEGLFQP